MTKKSFFHVYLDANLDPLDYARIDLHGVRDCNLMDGEAADPDAQTDCRVDDDNPQSFSAYLVGKDGICEVIADASPDKLQKLRRIVQELAEINGWAYKDHTLFKLVLTCPLCAKKVPNLFGPLHLCLDCCALSPHIGTKVISIQGETSDTEDGQDVFTGVDAEGIVEQILPDQENAFSVVFPNGVGVFLGIREITDPTRYRLAKKYNVHVFAVVRVAIKGVEAANQVEAIKQAEACVDFNALLDRGPDCEYAEQVDSYAVDEVGDEEYLNSRYYNPDYTGQTGDG
jgi:hypothetical protein